MQSRQLTNPVPPTGRPSTANSGRYKAPREQKVYYIPPPPPSTFHRGGHRPVAPIYSHSNSSYHGSTPNLTRSTTSDTTSQFGGPNTKTTFPFRTRTDSNVSSSSSATLTSSRSPSPDRDSGKGSPPAEHLPPRPPGVPTSRYIHMLLSIDSIPKFYNLLAAFSTWILLAGYVLLPGTFTSIQNLPSSSTESETEPGEDAPNAFETWILDRVRNTPLLYIAAVCSALGVLGMSLLWFRWRRNYVWIINRIFLPGTLNSLAGIISTIVNVHTAQQGKYSLTAIVSITVTAVSTVINGTLWLVYSNWALKRVQEMHAREYFGKKDEESMGKMELGESGGLVEVHDPVDEGTDGKGNSRN